MSAGHWSSVKLLDATVKVGSGATPKGGREAYHESGVPLIRSLNVRFEGFQEDGLAFLDKDQASELENATVAANDVLLNITGASIGRVAITPLHMDGARVNQHVCIIRPSDGLEPSFLRWFLTSPQQQSVIFSVESGVTRQALTKGMILDFDIPLPSSNEQRRIVEKIEELFSDLDAGVAALERAKANLKRYRAAVLKSAVDGSLTDEWRSSHPDFEPASKLLERILTERRRKWEADQLAKFKAAGKEPPKNWRAKYVEPMPPDTANLPVLPDGWCWASVEQLVVRSEYGTSLKCDYSAHGVPVLRIPNIAASCIDLSDIKYAAQPVNLSEGDELLPGDMLMCRTNGSIRLIGKAAVVTGRLTVAHSFASYLLRFRFAQSCILPFWVHAYVSSIAGRKFIEGNAASSAGQHNISLSLVSRMPIPLPPTAEQNVLIDEINERLYQTDNADGGLAKSILRATRLRQSILKQAFEGQLVPQDPKDEPANVLLDRIRSESQPHEGNGQPAKPKPRKKTEQKAS